MKPGHAFTIEPMISEGESGDENFVVRIRSSSLFFCIVLIGVWTDTTWPDNWTAVTTDGKLSAQFEQTMVVTDKGVEVLTARKGDKRHVPYFQDPDFGKA